MGFVISLVIIGLFLLLAEIVVIPGVGFAGFLGIGTLAGACFYAFHEIGKTAGGIVTGICCLLILVLLTIVLRGKTWTRLALNTNIESKATEGNRTPQVGSKGTAITRLSPMGNVRFDDDIVEVYSLDGIIDAGTEVTAVLVEDNKIYVKLINEY